jgi:hypothetical protein
VKSVRNKQRQAHSFNFQKIRTDTQMDPTSHTFSALSLSQLLAASPHRRPRDFSDSSLSAYAKYFSATSCPIKGPASSLWSTVPDSTSHLDRRRSVARGDQ